MKKLVFLFCTVSIILSACKNSTANSSTTDNSESQEQTIVHPKAPKAEGTPRILLVGNSHTEYFTSLPVLFGELCDANNQPMYIDKLVSMGVAIDEIYEDNQNEAEANFAKTDADGNYYDFVVLQEKTPIALQDLNEYKANVKMIVDKIHKNSPGVAIYIYEGMSPVPYEGNESEFKEYYTEMRKNALAVVAECQNAGLFRIGDAIKDAYNGKSNYKYQVAGKDNLRFGENTLHLINDGGFMQAVLLYATLFDKKPVVPAELTLSTGTGDDDGMTKQPVSQAISNSSALETIAFDNR